MKKRILSVIALGLLALGIAFAAPTSFSQHPAGQVMSQVIPEGRFDGVKLYHKAFEQIRDLHIKIDSPEKIEAFTKEWEHKFDKTGELDTEEGTDKAIRKMIQSLGQRFDYAFDRDATKAEREQIDATLTGIGATLSLPKLPEIAKTLPKDAKPEEVKKAIEISTDNYLQIESPMEGSPAEKAGVLAGDIIRKVDGKDLAGMQMEEAVKLIKGKAGSSVTLDIERDGKSISLSVVRAQVTVPDVKFKDLGDGVSYVKLNDFMSKNAVREMREALTKAGKGKALILDLRGNPGGSLPAVITMTGFILEDGPVLVIKSRNGDHMVESEVIFNKNFGISTQHDGNSGIEIETQKRPPLLIPSDMPIVVLVDEGSASASEILSGSLQHNRRAVIVGMPTVGKGVGQTVVQLPFGRSLHITSFEFIPGRTPNDWSGVIPDVEIKRGEDRNVDLQLEKAKELIGPMVKAVDDLHAKREAQSKLHHDEFEKALAERNKN